MELGLGSTCLGVFGLFPWVGIEQGNRMGQCAHRHEGTLKEDSCAAVGWQGTGGKCWTEHSSHFTGAQLESSQTRVVSDHSLSFGLGERKVVPSRHGPTSSKGGHLSLLGPSLDSERSTWKWLGKPGSWRVISAELQIPAIVSPFLWDYSEEKESGDNLK